MIDGDQATDEAVRDMVAHLGGAIVWQTDAAAQWFSFVSNSAAGLLGYPIEDWYLEPYFLKHHVPASDWSNVVEALYAAAVEGGRHNCEHQMVRADGSIMWAQTSVERSSRSNGELLLAGLSIDVSKSHELEQDLRRSAADARRLVDSLRDCAVFMVEANGQVAGWNKAAQRLFGYGEAEVSGTALADFFPADERAKGTFPAMLERAQLDGGSEYEGPILKKDGRLPWVSLTVNVVRDEAGQLRGYSALCRNAGARRGVDERLRESEERFRRLVEGLHDHGLFMLSGDGRIECWNNGAQRLLGHRPADMIGAPFALLLSPQDAGEGRADLLMREATRAGRAVYEGWVVGRGTEKCWCQLTLNAIDSPAAGFSVLVRDLGEQRRTEQALRDSEARFRRIVESVQDYAVIMLSVDGLVESWNAGAQRLKGYRRNEIIGSSMARFFPEDQQDKHIMKTLLTAASLDGLATYEGWLVRKNGERFWGLLTLNAVEDEDGDLKGYTNVARNLGDRKSTEDRLRESEEKLRLLIESVSDYGLYMVASDGTIASWGPGAMRLRGYSAHEVVGTPVARFFPADAEGGGVHERLLARAVAEGRAEYEGWLVEKNGHHFWGSVALSAIRAPDGTLRGLSSVERDLTARMRAERAETLKADVGRVLAGSLDYTRTLERVAHLFTPQLGEWCIVHISNDGAIEPRAFAHSELAKERQLAAAVRPIPSRSRFVRGIASVVETGRAELTPDIASAGWAAEALGLEDSELLGSLENRSYICVPLTARGNTFGAILLVSKAGARYTAEDLLLAEDLANRAALSIDSARLYEEAQRAIATREEVMAIVSHDLRGPLSAVLMAAQSLARPHAGKDFEAKTRETGARIERVSQQMLRLIRDLLDFSSMVGGRLRIETAVHDGEALATEAVQTYQPVASEKGVRLERGIDIGRAQVRCDRDRILQVFSNLIGNAIRFAEEGGTVTVGGRRDATSVVFCVADNGPGIAPEELPHVFDRYWQGRLEKSQGSGVGLGLAIVRGIIESHGGTIWVESELGRGTTFSFTLPLAA